MPKLPKSFSGKKAHQTQLCLSKKLIIEDRLPSLIQTVAGIDVAYVDSFGVGAAVVLDYESLIVLETKIAVCKVTLPYIPTLLSFRELPPAMSALRKLKLQPDVFMVDAQGYAHPYRCGFASHLGLALGKPTIGVAKSSLIGESVEKEGRVLLMDKGEVIGEVISTKPGAKPVYVSVGHMVSLETATAIARHCVKNRIPEPTLQAHNLATKTKQDIAAKAK